MAEDSKVIYGKGVAFAGSIDIGAIGNFPLDSRLIVKSPEGLEELQTEKRVYDGMLVYCESNQAYYKARVVWDAAANITSCTWTEVVISSEKELKALIASETTAAMEFKGTVADGVLPVKTETAYTTLSKGDMYKIVTKSLTIPKGNNAENVTEDVIAQPGDSIVYEGDHKWYLIQSGDDIEDTWRPQTWGGVTLDSRAPLNVAAGGNITIAATADGNVTISATDTDTHHEAKLVITDSKAGVECKDVDIATGDMYINLVENGEVRTAHKIAIEENSPIEITNKKATKEGEVDTLTIKSLANAKDQNGYVTGPTKDDANKVWKTDKDGNPGWRIDEDTKYTGTDKITVDGTVIKHNKLAANAKDSNKNTPIVTEAENTTSTVISGVAVDEYGHVTGYTTAEVYIPDVSLDNKSISRNDENQIEIKGFKKDAANGNIPRVVVDAQGNKAIEWVTVKEAVSDIDDANTITRGDGASIEEAYNGTKDTYTLSIKGVKDAATTDGKILAADGKGGVKWVEDKNTAHDHSAGTGLKITSTNTGGIDGTVVYAHQDKPTSGDAAGKLGDGASRTYVTDVIIDSLGHVAGVNTKTETVVDKDTKTKIESGDEYVVVDEITFTENTTNTYTISLDEDKLKSLIGAQTTAAMEFKGVVSELPASGNTGDMYKAAADFDIPADLNAQGNTKVEVKIGDTIVCEATTNGDTTTIKWYYIPSGDDFDNTWRPVKVDNNSLETTEELKLNSSDRIALTENAGSVTFDIVEESITENYLDADLQNKIDTSAELANNAVLKEDLYTYITRETAPLCETFALPIEVVDGTATSNPVVIANEHLVVADHKYSFEAKGFTDEGTYYENEDNRYNISVNDSGNLCIKIDMINFGEDYFEPGAEHLNLVIENQYDESNNPITVAYCEDLEYQHYLGDMRNAHIVFKGTTGLALGIEPGAQVNVIDKVGNGLILDGKTIELNMTTVSSAIFNDADTYDIYAGLLEETFTLSSEIKVGQYYQIAYVRSMESLEDVANIEYSTVEARKNGFNEVYMYASIEGESYCIIFNENEGKFDKLPEFSEDEQPLFMITHVSGAGVERGAQVNKIEAITSIASSHDEHDECANCGGLKVTHDETTKTTNIEIDDSITFIFNCGGAADLI